MDICIFGAAVPHSHCLRVWMWLNLGAPVYRSLQAWQVCPARWLATPEEMTTHTPAADQGSSEELLRSVAELFPTLDCCVTTHQCFQHISECKPATVWTCLKSASVISHGERGNERAASTGCVDTWKWGHRAQTLGGRHGTGVWGAQGFIFVWLFTSL